MMRKFNKGLLLCLVICLFFLLFASPIGAEEIDVWDSWQDSLPSGVADALPEDASGSVGIESLLEYIIGAAEGEVGHFITLLFSLVGITLLGGVATMVAGDAAEGLKNGISLTATLATAIAVYHAIAGVIEDVNIYLQDVLKLADGLSPVVVGILISGGAANTAVAAGANLSGLLLLMEHLCVGVLPPLAGASFAFSLIGSLPSGVKTQGIAGSLRGIYLTLLGTLTTVASASLRLQTVITSARDSVAMQTARFAVGNMIPLAGNAIGATLGTLQSSLSLIKSTVGSTAILALLLITLPTLIQLVSTRLALSLSSSVAQLIGYTTGERLLLDLRGVIDLLLAVTALVSVSLILYLAVFLRLSFGGV